MLKMSSTDIVDLCSDDDPGAKAVKMEPDLVGRSMQEMECHTIDVTRPHNSKIHQESEENRSFKGQRGTDVLGQEQPPVDDTNPCYTSPICSAPLCRQFWKAGNYNEGLTPMSTLKNGTSYLNIHPKFLHSNATSHKWAFGAIAELIDNAVDEIQNGATFVIVDETPNPRNGSPALLIQDDGGGMDPEAMRRCLSFGFSNKKTESAIGQYGNGFKTSSMRLGADVIVFSRHKNRELTQSIGLLSYTFLSQTGHDRIVVPMVHYEFNTATGTMDPLRWHSKESFMSNISILLQWSPYSTENELLKQFSDIMPHGTKVIIYNLWYSDEGIMELDFKSDPEDICITGEAKSIKKGGSRMSVSEQHLANRLCYSLRAYLSILYLRIPDSFYILLRGQRVEYHNIASDLKYHECIVYRPQSGRSVEGTVITTIGFLKEAPHVNIHGFNVYHKNRLIMPFWRVVSYTDSRGRGVVGVLEANFIEPIHNKQDFEKTSVFQKLEARLKEMTWEYWDYHCGLIGYQVKKKPRVPMPIQGSSDSKPHHGTHQPVVLSINSSAVGSTRAVSAGGALQPPAAASFKSSVSRLRKSIPDFQRSYNNGAHLKRKEFDHSKETEKVKRKAGKGPDIIDTGPNLELQPVITTGNQLEDHEAMTLIEDNKKLLAQCLEYKKREEELNLKVIWLRTELGEVQGEYCRLLAESQLLEEVKEENNVYLISPADSS